LKTNGDKKDLHPEFRQKNSKKRAKFRIFARFLLHFLAF